MREVILLIDDSEAIHRLVKSLLVRRFEVLSAYDGKNGLLAAAKHKPDLILLDADMPALHGTEVCRQLKADRNTRDIPVVFVTTARSIGGRIRGLDAGACDYVIKPFEPAELQARVRAALRTRRSMVQLSRNTMVDEFTGLVDRKYFEEQLDAGLAASQRTGRPLGCILVHIDRMEAVNGAFGRELGDEMLRAVSDRLLQTSRREDVPCRFGEDEFAILVTDANEESLAIYAEHIRQAIRSVVVHDEERIIQVTTSLGISKSDSSDAAPLLHAAQAALGRARGAGGDRVAIGDTVIDTRAAA